MQFNNTTVGFKPEKIPTFNYIIFIVFLSGSVYANETPEMHICMEQGQTAAQTNMIEKS